MVRYTSVLFSQEDAMKIFGVAEFDPGNDESTFPYPYRGSICCKGKDGTGKPHPFRIPFAWWSKHKIFMVKSGNPNNSKLCLMHNHTTSAMELDGCQYITSQINLTKDEVSSIHTLSNHYHWGVSSPRGLIHRVPQENLLHRFNSPIHGTINVHDVWRR